MSRPAATATAAVLFAAALSGCGSAARVEDPDQGFRLDVIRRATLKYRDRNVALADGYRPLPRCVESLEGDGAAGLEYLHLRRARDRKIVLLEPEQLFYSDPPSGKAPRLMAVGYFVPDDGQKPPESPLGHLDGPIPGQYRGQEPHFELHVWVHRQNPDGVLAFFNPEVECADRTD